MAGRAGTCTEGLEGQHIGWCHDCELVQVYAAARDGYRCATPGCGEWWGVGVWRVHPDDLLTEEYWETAAERGLQVYPGDPLGDDTGFDRAWSVSVSEEEKRRRVMASHLQRSVKSKRTNRQRTRERKEAESGTT